MPTPTSFPRIPDLPAYPTVLVVGGLVLALYVQLRKDRLNILMAESPPSNVESRLDKVSSTALPPIIVPANDIPSGVLSPTLRAEAPAFRPRADSGSPAGNIWTNIPERARELRKLAELQYQESCECKKRAQVYNAEAAKVIYNNKNKNPQGSWIDLHGLYATEAVSYANLAIDEAQERGVSLVKLIVGRGLHSADASAKVKPRVLEGMQKRGVRAEVDSTNDGVVTVYQKHRVRICSPNGEPVALASMMVASNDRRAA